VCPWPPQYCRLFPESVDFKIVPPPPEQYLVFDDVKNTDFKNEPRAIGTFTQVVPPFAVFENHVVAWYIRF